MYKPEKLDISTVLGNMKSWDEKRKEDPLTCNLCGKTDPTVDIFCGGPWGYAHEDCAQIASKGVELYLRHLHIVPSGLLWFAKELIENDPAEQFIVSTKVNKIE